MAGRAFTILWSCLQPILLLLMFIHLRPGRDTQDMTTYFAHTLLDPCAECVSTMLFQAFVACSVLIWQAGRASFWTIATGIAYILYRSTFPSEFLRFTRKHGRWRHFRFYPACFLLLSHVVLTPTQFATALIHQPGRVVRTTRRLSTLTRSFRAQDETDYLSMEKVLPMTVDPSCPSSSFFYDAVFDLLPFDDAPEVDTIPANLLHLWGIVEW